MAVEGCQKIANGTWDNEYRHTYSNITSSNRSVLSIRSLLDSDSVLLVYCTHMDAARRVWGRYMPAWLRDFSPLPWLTCELCMCHRAKW